MADPGDGRAPRVCAKLDFDNVGGSESAKTTVTRQGGGTITSAYVLHGFLLRRTSGTDGSLSVTVRFYDDDAAGALLYELTATLAANNGIMLKTGLEIPLGMPAFVALRASVQDDGADTDYDLYTYLHPNRVV